MYYVSNSHHIAEACIKQDRCEVNLHKHSMRYLFFTSQAPFPRLWRLSIALLTSLVIL